ncbi:MAG: hypothetical protein R2827_08960 [Bdellovibrionales bacterium]
MSGISESKFNMFRCVIAMAQQDGVIEKSELEEIGKMLEKVQLSDAQREALKHELGHKINLDEVLAQVTEKGDRAMLAHYARIMMYADGVAHPDEQALVEQLQKFAMDHADAVDIVTQYRKAYADYEKSSDKDIYSSNSKSILYKWFLDLTN